MRIDQSPTEFLRMAGHTAEHFGFQTLDALRHEFGGQDKNPNPANSATTNDTNLDSVSGRISQGVSTYFNEGWNELEKPIFLYTIDTTTNPNETAVSFHIFNVQKSIAEAILIQTTRAIASELGHDNNVVRINSLGDAESIVRYNRELTNFLRKRVDLMPTTARERMKTHSLLALQSLIDENHELAYKTPNPLEYLSDQSRKHFRDIIEYLDMTETAYEIDPKMLGHHDYYSDALFSIDGADGDETDGASLLLRGGRFDALLERKTKKKVGGVGAVAVLNNRPAPSRVPRTKLEAPSTYIIQLGFGPRVRSLMIIDELRKAGINVRQDLANDSLSAQLRDAENRGAKHVIIIGQKEFVDGTVIIRDMDARKQEVVANDSIVKRLKRAAQTVFEPSK